MKIKFIDIFGPLEEHVGPTPFEGGRRATCPAKLLAKQEARRGDVDYQQGVEDALPIL